MKIYNNWHVPDNEKHFLKYLHENRNTDYQQSAIDKAYQYVNKFGTVVDVGANIGLHAVRFSKKFQNVICFEPSSQNFQCLSANITDDNVELHNVGLGSKSDNLIIKTPKNHHNCGASSIVDWKNYNGDLDKEIVHIIALDSLHLEPDFIKIDVQGFEQEVIKGASKTIRNHKPTLMLECEKQKQRTRIQSLLKELDYHCIGREGQDYIWIHKSQAFRSKPEHKPETLCMAPWTHTYLSPQTERRLCCASREPAQSFKQYIDTDSGTGKYNPQSLQKWWNSDHVKEVRRKMMNGETPPECAVCNEKLLNTDVYRDYFWGLFQHKYDDIWENTDITGRTTMQPVSWDYRFSNLCNFKCRTCGDMLSSAWETEQRKHNMIAWDNPKNNWMRPEVKKQIEQFQDTQVEAEFSQAVEEHRVEEIYWVGGEPLMYEQHWRYMKRIVELGDGPALYARYNTNLSRVDYKGINLYSDILAHVRDWQVCASIDGTGPIGEYIRTGLKYDQWLENFKQGLAIAKHRRQMRLDFTLTLPGLFEVERIQQLAWHLNVDILSKVIFTFTPDIVMSPLALPRELLNRKIDQLITVVGDNALKDTLVQLKNRFNIEEMWPGEYQTGLKKGKERILRLEEIRNDTYTMSDILEEDPEIHEWWQSI